MRSPLSFVTTLSAALNTGSHLAEKRLLVLGGTGFVGSRVVKKAVSLGYAVTSLSRRGTLPGLDFEGVNWISGDASDPEVIKKLQESEGGFDAGIVHAIGMLVEGEANRLASGSGSIPDKGATFDKVTRQTAFAAMDSIAGSPLKGRSVGEIPFVFISAAEVKWTFDAKFQNTPLEFLNRYFIAKRAVEDRLLSEPGLRPVILRPSLIWSKDRPFGIPPAAAFAVGNVAQRLVGLDVIDSPVNVDTLVSAALKGIQSPSMSGIYDGKAMRDLENS